MLDFCALDFETATHERNSACELGVTLVENGEIKETKTWLIKPPSYPYFHPRNIDVHGITPEEVKDAPTFDDIWYEVYDLLYGHIFLAHNASFDAGVLRSCLNHYGIFLPKLDYMCSIQLAKKTWKNLPSYGLRKLADLHHISFNHHRAGDDANVCAQLSLLAFNQLMITRNEEIAPFFKASIKKL